MSDLQIIGPQYGSLGAPKPFTAGGSGAQRVQDAHGRYLQAVMENRAFFLSVAAGAVTAYTGGAAGTPLLAVHNPTGSGKVLVPLLVGFAPRAAASAAGQANLELWSGPSAAPTGTKTGPTNALSLSAAGSAALGFVNTALTGSTALALAMPLSTYYWATAAGAFMSQAMFDVAGFGVAAPGNQFTVGLTAALTSLTADAAIFWEEIPYQPLG
jgi:hypothetical protein